MGCANKAPSIQALLEHTLSHVLLITPCHKCRKTGSPCAHRQAQTAALGQLSECLLESAPMSLMLVCLCQSQQKGL